MTNIPNEIVKQIKTVTNRRARFVLDAIVKNGIVTTEEISRAGYEHPPRAARDVRELGFPLRTIRVKHTNGRSIAAYTLQLEGELEEGKAGRKELPKKVRDVIIQKLGGKCQICGSKHNIQLDHRIPYQVAGESLSNKTDSYQLLCGSCNRKKSWACEHCQNWLKDKDATICSSCYWVGSPTYTHIALKQERRLEIVWGENEIKEFDRMVDEARHHNSTIEDEIKNILRSYAK